MIDKNITKKAAAISYDEDVDFAPKVIAKGGGEIANNIIKIAKDNDIPIKKDEDLVELLSQIDLNKEIPPNLYKAVAEVFSFIYGIDNEKENK